MASPRWTIGARSDLREAVAYVAADSLTYATATARRLISAVERLDRYPRLGRTVPEYGDPALRELIVGSYRVVYCIENREVVILAIVHGSRDLLSHLGDEPWNLE